MGSAIAAAAFVVSVAIGLVTNVLTGERGWGFVAGLVVLLALVAAGIWLAWRQGAHEAEEPAAIADPRPRLGVVVPPLGQLPAHVRGREELLDRLTELVAQPDGLVHVLSGLGGSGKTTIALAVSERAGHGGDAWWVNARDRASLDTGLLDLARALKVSNEQLAQVRAGIASLLELIWERLEAAARPWLLVVDNADMPELLAADGGMTRDGTGVARASAAGLTLVTSRDGNTDVWGGRAVVHPVEPLSPQDGADILLDLAGPSAGSRAEAVALAGRLGGLPLALRAAGRYLSSTSARMDGVVTFPAYCAVLANRFADLLGPVSAESNPRDVVITTWELSLDLLAVRGLPQARPIMRLIGQFAPAPIPARIGRGGPR